MKIHNNFRALDKEIMVIEQELDQLAKLREQISRELDKLYNDGFKDKKFLELKTAVEKSGRVIIEYKKTIEQYTTELQKRSEVIKQYYAVAL